MVEYISVHKWPSPRQGLKEVSFLKKWIVEKWSVEKAGRLFLIEMRITHTHW